MKMEQSVPKRRHIKFRRGTNSSHLPAYEDGTECFETSAYKILDAGEFLHTCLPMKMEQSVPKRRHIKFRRGTNSPHLSAYEDGTECSETSAYKIQTPLNYPEGSIQHLNVC